MAYPEALLDHYRAPRHRGALEGLSGEARNPLCGDAITMHVQVVDGKCAAVGFEGVGCAISLGTADMLAEYLIGRQVKDARFDLAAIEAMIGMTVVEGRRRCATLPAEALAVALGID